MYICSYKIESAQILLMYCSFIIVFTLPIHVKIQYCNGKKTEHIQKR